jgi:hypothetical protein
MLIIGAGAELSAKKKPHREIIAYSLGGGRNRADHSWSRVRPPGWASLGRRP